MRKNWIRRIITGLPLAPIIGASFFHLRTLDRQILILFTLLWFNAYILLEVMGGSHSSSSAGN